jgi:ribosome maturation factor RimP
VDVVNAVESMLSPLLSDKGIELIDVQWRGESNGWILRVFLDKPGGISLDECAHWSSTLGDFIE